MEAVLAAPAAAQLRNYRWWLVQKDIFHFPPASWLFIDREGIRAGPCTSQSDLVDELRRANYMPSGSEYVCQVDAELPPTACKPLKLSEIAINQTSPCLQSCDFAHSYPRLSAPQ